MADRSNRQRDFQQVIRCVLRGHAPIQVLETGPRRSLPRSYPPNHPPEVHDRYEIVICFEGEMMLVGPRQNHRLRAGDIFIVPPGAWHYESYRSPRRSYKSCWFAALDTIFNCTLGLYHGGRFHNVGYDLVHPMKLRPLALQELADEVIEKPLEWRTKTLLLTRNFLG